ncbi:MAG TPA: nitrite reductase large subunit NirB [Solirubrobacteraceae bacterium]|jgi:nitrite reductase (NADH) large subunit|nr:nitrite reductase large subunit NirB [Solirubrobacteraceae bacterium]
MTAPAAGIVVVGGGIAGQAVVEAVRDRDPEVPVTLICGEPRLPYDRVRLSEILASGEDPDALTLRPGEWFADRGVRVLTGQRVARLDLDEHALELESGERVSFGRLALATGSQPLLPPIPGIDLQGVYAFRGPEDCDAIRSAAASEGVHRAVVIGGGLLGLEAARGIVAQGCAVTVVHLMGRVMERQLDAGAAELLLPRLRELGVEVLLERQTDAIIGDERAQGLRFRDGEELDADLVVISIGIRPETSLARAAGLDCQRGIIVGDRMETSMPAVVAVGECAEHRGVVYGLVAPIIEQARVAAMTLLEREGDPYRGSIPSAKLKVAGIDLVAIGAAEGDSEAISVDAGAGMYRKLVVRDGLAAGAVLLGDVRGSEALLAEIAGAHPVSDPLGRLAAAAELGPEDLPDSAQICNCNSVCKGQLTVAVTEGGCATPREVMASTRAGTGCGSCRSSVIAIVAAATGGLSDEPAYLCPCERQTREELAGQIRANGWRSVSEVADACRTGRQCGACKPALAYLISEVNDNRHREERHARFINDRVHANIQRDGTFSVVPRIHGGVVTPDQLRRIADAADKYHVPMVKITGGQRIDLLGVRKQDLPAIWRDLGMTSGYAYSKAVRTVKTCVGTDFCRYGLGDSIALGIEMEKAWEGLHTPHKVKSGVSGCPRNCAEATVKDIGVVALEDAWQVRIGGAAGGSVREGDVLCTVNTRAEALRATTAFLQYYREHAEYKERTYDFVPRMGLDKVREAVLGEDSSAGLLERLRIAKAATLDPWLERDAPYHPRQFNDLDAPGDADEAPEAEEDDEPSLVGPPPGGAR